MAAAVATAAPAAVGRPPVLVLKPLPTEGFFCFQETEEWTTAPPRGVSADSSQQPSFLYTDFMTILALDTSADAESVMFGIYRKMPAWRRLELLDEACRLSIELARAGLRRRNPNASEKAIERLLRDLMLGEDLAAVVYGPAEQ